MLHVVSIVGNCQALEKTRPVITFFTVSSRADLISDKLALLIFVIGSGSEAREEEEEGGVVGREDPLGAALRGAMAIES